MDTIKNGVVGVLLLVFGGLIFFLYTNMDTTQKVDVNSAEVLAQIAEEKAEMAAYRNGGKLKPELESRAKALRQRADKIAAEAQVQKVKRDSVLDRLAGWFRDVFGAILGTS